MCHIGIIYFHFWFTFFLKIIHIWSVAFYNQPYVSKIYIIYGRERIHGSVYSYFLFLLGRNRRKYNISQRNSNIMCTCFRIYRSKHILLNLHQIGVTRVLNHPGTVQNWGETIKMSICTDFYHQDLLQNTD